MRRSAAIILLFATLLLAAGCGSRSERGAGTNGAPAGTLEGEGLAPNVGPQGRAAREAALACGNFPLTVLASQYGVKPTPEAVADAVAKDYPVADRPAARKACLDALGER